MLYYFSLGSNLGDRFSYIEKMENFLLEKLDQPMVSSSLMETAPVDVSDEQLPYLNKIISGLSNLAPQEMLKECQYLENELGRENKGAKLARTADIDILLVDDVIFTDDSLTIPHPAICDRRFILEGLIEMDEELIHPVLKKSISALYSEMKKCIKDQEITIIK